jgi:ribonuclease BN (tRNA processing enzyme)
MTSVSFLGTGNYLAPGRYWNSFVVDRSILVEPAPTALPHLRRMGLGVADLDVVVVSHFHPDHTFGWPFLLLEIVRTRPADRPLHVVGPPELEGFLADMMALGSVSDITATAHRGLDVRYVEVDGTWQDAGPLRFRAVEVEHVPHLRCFGYLFDMDGHVVGYSGDTHPCPGLDELAGASDVLVLECNGPHPPPVIHMDVDSVGALRDRFPGVPFVLTHLGGGIEASKLANTVVPADFDVLTV